MHPASVFRWDDRAAMLALVASRAFATVIGTVDARPMAALVPVLVEGDRLILHLSRANPLVAALPQRVLVVVGGPDAYVSPDWYAEPDQVPTWNYLAVEIEGELVPTDDAMLLEILRRQSAAFEARIPGKPPWQPEQMTPAVLAAKLRGIVGATLTIETLRGTCKLSQNKSSADRAGVIAALEASGRAADRAIALAIRAAEG